VDLVLFFASSFALRQDGIILSYAVHPLDELTKQCHIAVRVHRAREPQARADHHRQGHLPAAALVLDPQLVGLHLPEITWLFDEMLLHRPVLSTASRPPTGHGPLVEAKRRDGGLERTAGASKVTTRVTVSAAGRRRYNAVPLVTLNVLWHVGQRKRWSLHEGVVAQAMCNQCAGHTPPADTRL